MNQPALKDKMYFLTKNAHFRIPHPPQMNNHGNFIVSLSNFVKWMGEQAEELGAEIYSGISASEVLYNKDGSVKGIATNDVGIGKDGKPKDSCERGMEIHAKLTIFAVYFTHPASFNHITTIGRLSWKFIQESDQ